MAKSIVKIAPDINEYLRNETKELFPLKPSLESRVDISNHINQNLDRNFKPLAVAYYLCPQRLCSTQGQLAGRRALDSSVL